MSAEWTRAKAGALEFIEAMPEELLGFKPCPDVFSFAEQFVHIAQANFRFAAVASGLPNPMPADPMADTSMKSSKLALAHFVGSSYDFIIQSLGAVSAEAMSETITLHKWEMTREVAFSKALEHHAHHRGQTVVYFRVNGLKPPPERLF